MHAFTKLDQENLSSRGIQVHPCPFNADSHVTAENVETNFIILMQPKMMAKLPIAWPI